MGLLATTARVLHVLLLSLWIGASSFYLLLRHSLLEAASSRHEAAELLGRGLAQIDLYGLAAGPLLLVTLLAGWASLQVPLRLRALLAALMTVAVAVSGRLVAPELARVRARMGRPLEDMDPASPLMVQADELEAYALGLMLTHLAAALFLLVTAVAAARKKRTFGIEL